MTSTPHKPKALNTISPWLLPSRPRSKQVKLGGISKIYRDPASKGRALSLEALSIYNCSISWKIDPSLEKEYFDALEFLKGKGSAEALLDKYLNGDLSRIHYVNSVLVNRVRATNPEKAKRMVTRMSEGTLYILIKEGVLPKSYAQRVNGKLRDDLFAIDLGL